MAMVLSKIINKCTRIFHDAVKDLNDGFWNGMWVVRRDLHGYGVMAQGAHPDRRWISSTCVSDARMHHQSLASYGDEKVGYITLK